eukprot:CAMPEP_0180265212 /NCGR_PEP_ID=MMETSP0988-20121125/311_1 /TAXON_ID=697907 /ORGANISM="non described non described, Strain CCMP2293" /LENGTH=47 /DNA_ID= /DNA_START= /DNA_END= /DNA_ORIENTATION=
MCSVTYPALLFLHPLVKAGSRQEPLCAGAYGTPAVWKAKFMTATLRS